MCHWYLQNLIITGIILQQNSTVNLTVVPTILFSQQSFHSESLRDPSLLGVFGLRTCWTSTSRFSLDHLALDHLCWTSTSRFFLDHLGLDFGLILNCHDELAHHVRHTVWAHHVRRARGAHNVKAARGPAYNPQAAFVCHAAGAANHLTLMRVSAQYTSIISSPRRKGGRRSHRIRFDAEGSMVRRAMVRKVPPRVRHGSEWNQGRTQITLKHSSKNCCGLQDRTKNEFDRSSSAPLGQFS